MPYENKYRLIFECFSDGILVVEREFISFLNTAIMDITGFSWADLTLRPVIKFVYPEDRMLVTDYCNAILKGGNEDILECRILTKDRNLKRIEIKANRINWDNGLAVLVFVTDITAHEKIKKFEPGRGSNE